MTDLYKLLGVLPEATQKEIVEGYREQARINHPDKKGPQTVEKFQKIREAFEILKDPATRKAYDSGENPKLLTIRTEAVDRISKAVIALIDLTDVSPESDLVLCLRLNNTEKIKRMQAMVKEHQKKKNRFTRLINRFRKKTPGENIIKNALDKKVDQLMLDMGYLKKEIRICEEVDVMLTDYTFETIRLLTMETAVNVYESENV